MITMMMMIIRDDNIGTEYVSFHSEFMNGMGFYHSRVFHKQT